jgi:hypothetical protein
MLLSLLTDLTKETTLILFLCILFLQKKTFKCAQKHAKWRQLDKVYHQICLYNYIYKNWQ